MGFARKWGTHCLALVSLVTSAAATEGGPNIVLIFCDDLGYADVGFNAALFGVETDVVTPEIDALAAKGTIFKQAYVAHPFCGPSRMALLSGRMPHTFGGQKNLPDVAKNLEDYNEKGIPESESLISTVLQKAGYATACIGKWHLGAAPAFHPNARGFDEFYGFAGGGHQYYPSITDKVEPKINDYQYFLERNGEEIRSPEGAYLTDTLIVFLSDNGGKIAQAASNAPLQDDKGSTLEGGIRVPMFMHWPGKVPSGAVFDHPVLALDLFPTFAGLAGASIPPEKILDGKNAWADFLAGVDPHAGDTMFWLRHHGGGNEVAIRRGNFKAYRKNGGKWKVFDVTTDFGETEDVAAASVERLPAMIEAGRVWSKTHQEPQWHDTAAGLKRWKENGMPRYEVTFPE